MSIAQEIERKRQRLAEIKARKAMQEEERKNNVLAPIENASRRETTTKEEVEALLRSVGFDIASGQPIQEENDAEEPRSPPSSPVKNGFSSTTLEYTPVSTFVVHPKEPVQYSKEIQTDGDPLFESGSNTSLCLGETQVTTQLDTTIQQEKSIDEQQLVDEHKEPELPKTLTEQEKNQICSNTDFQLFLHNASKMVERHLAMPEEIFAMYSLEETMVAQSDEMLLPKGIFCDSKWTHNRAITAMVFGSTHKELIAVAYDHDKDQPYESPGIVCIWNTKIIMNAPEFVFQCNSRITSIIFGRFHQHLITAGCYSGQIVMWDYRIANKRTPTTRCGQSNQTHTQPIFGLETLGTATSNKMYSVSSDGKICTWNTEDLIKPVPSSQSELNDKAKKKVPTISVSFAVDDAETFVVGAEDGKVICDFYGNSITILWHTGPVTCIDIHSASCGSTSLSHLFLTGSTDWGIKLWSTEDPKLRISFDAHQDVVVDVKWSPTHPAVFASIDKQGILLLWNLNENVETPILATDVTKGERDLRKLTWSRNGMQICVGDGTGNAYLFDTHEALYTTKQEDFMKFSQALTAMKQDAEMEGSVVNNQKEITGGAYSIISALANRRAN